MTTIENVIDDGREYTTFDESTQRIINKLILHRNGDLETIEFDNLKVKTRKIIGFGTNIEYEYDNMERVILTKRDDGFKEEIQYQGDTHKPKRIETWYPDGQHEIEHYGSWKH